MRPPDRLFDFNRVNSMPVNMADIVQLPIEALQPIKHTYSIYIFRMYTSYRGGGGRLNGNPAGLLIGHNQLADIQLLNLAPRHSGQ